jgi:hypothetical protein
VCTYVRAVHEIAIDALSQEKLIFLWTLQVDAVPGLPDFSSRMTPKPDEMYQINTNCTKWS